MQSTLHVDGQIHAGLQGLTEKDLLYIIGPLKGDRLYVANNVMLKVLCVVPITALRLTHSLFWFWSKKWGWRLSCKHIGGIVIGFKACSRSQCICIDICTNLSWPVGLMYTTRKAVCLARCGHKKNRLGGLDTCLWKENSHIAEKMNLVGFLDSTRIAAAGLNHLMDHLLG